MPYARAQRLTEANVIVGDLGGDFTEADLAHLAEASHVINCAALASFSTNPQVLDINVRDTLRFASHFAGSKVFRRFLHVSTAMACAMCGKEAQAAPKERASRWALFSRR